MPRRTQELIDARRGEIIGACEELYATMGFKDITMADIARKTTFTRTSIYNYFQTKEEIFLALLQREYDSWADAIDDATERSESMSEEEIAGFLAGSLAERGQMLRILSMNHYDMEAGSRIGNLTDFKRSYGRTLDSVESMLRKFCDGLSEEDISAFVYSFFPFLYGLCPYTEVTPKQEEAMEAAGIGFVRHTVYDLAYGTALGLLTANRRR
ncbi:MAG: TetR family transcriptional regulator [Candidatus Methanomethylophilaceae archaeon]|nr:TetR family transcriptional regulator [Candidatus Methanomethylophilaceae archaeon]